MNKSKNDNNAHSWHTERLEDKDKKERHNDHRSPYELDKTRVVHSFPFRRLQGKFQMISGAECDFNRNRLTHSLEVASLAKNIYLNLEAREKDKKDYPYTEINSNIDTLEMTTLLETISLLHDICHHP